MYTIDTFTSLKTHTQIFPHSHDTVFEIKGATCTRQMHSFLKPYISITNCMMCHLYGIGCMLFGGYVSGKCLILNLNLEHSHMSTKKDVIYSWNDFKFEKTRLGTIIDFITILNKVAKVNIV